MRARSLIMTGRRWIFCRAESSAASSCGMASRRVRTDTNVFNNVGLARFWVGAPLPSPLPARQAWVERLVVVTKYYGGVSKACTEKLLALPAFSRLQEIRFVPPKNDEEPYTLWTQGAPYLRTLDFTDRVDLGVGEF